MVAGRLSVRIPGSPVRRGVSRATCHRRRRCDRASTSAKVPGTGVTRAPEPADCRLAAAIPDAPLFRAIRPYGHRSLDCTIPCVRPAYPSRGGSRAGWLRAGRSGRPGPSTPRVWQGGTRSGAPPWQTDQKWGSAGRREYQWQHQVGCVRSLSRRRLLPRHGVPCARGAPARPHGRPAGCRRPPA